MSAIYAELHMAGHVYPLRRCTYGLSQATNGRGRVTEKVRASRVEILMDVPRDQFVEAWATAVYKPLDGYVVFFDAKGGAAIETVSWQAGHCVYYGEDFEAGSVTTGSYVARVRIAAARLVLSAGGPPAPFVAPAPREHGPPPVALLGVPPVLETLTVEELAVTVAPELLPLAPVLLPAAAIIAAVLALIVATTTPAQAPGLPVDPRLLRLRQLTAQHAAGTLTADEEAELIDLLAKVKGVRVQKLSDLVVEGKYKKQPQVLPGFHFEEITYTKRSAPDTDALRRKFDSSVRARFMKKISSDSDYVRQLRDAGFDDDDLVFMQSGRVPDDWEVHHKLPLDDGGNNDFSNLLLIKSSPYHSVVTGYQKTNTGKLKPGESIQIKWPTYNQGIVYPPQKP